MDEAAASLENRIAETRKRITDLTTQAGQPFEYDKRFEFLVQRQQEIEEALDLTKNQAPVALETEAEAEPEDQETSREQAEAVESNCVV